MNAFKLPIVVGGIAAIVAILALIANHGKKSGIEEAAEIVIEREVGLPDGTLHLGTDEEPKK